MLEGEQLLELWEAGTGRNAFLQGLLLLGVAQPQIPPQELEDVTLADRNLAVLGLRRSLYGPQADAQVPCRHCGEGMEIQLNLDAMIEASEGVGRGSLTTRDLRSVEGLDRAEARRRLEPLIATGEAESLALITIAAICPACGQQGSYIFDPITFLWQEVEVRGRRLMREVQSLARALAWSEAAILAMSPPRRRHYLLLSGLV